MGLFVTAILVLTLGMLTMYVVSRAKDGDSFGEFDIKEFEELIGRSDDDVKSSHAFREYSGCSQTFVIYKKEKVAVHYKLSPDYRRVIFFKRVKLNNKQVHALSNGEFEEVGNGQR